MAESSSHTTDENTPITLESANRRLSEVFAPWIQDLDLRVTSLGGGEVKLLLPYNNRLCRAGDMICGQALICLLYTSPSPRDATLSRMPSSA